MYKFTSYILRDSTDFILRGLRTRPIHWTFIHNWHTAFNLMLCNYPRCILYLYVHHFISNIIEIRGKENIYTYNRYIKLNVIIEKKIIIIIIVENSVAYIIRYFINLLSMEWRQRVTSVMIHSQYFDVYVMNELLYYFQFTFSATLFQQCVTGYISQHTLI